MKNIFKNPFKVFFPRKVVGVDIGTSAIKLVELSVWGETKKLENYGEIKSKFLYKEPSLNEKSSNILSTDIISKAIRAILEEARIKTKAVTFSISDFSTFCTSFDIPPMTEKEIATAIRYNAAQYITLPITEVTLDWRVMPLSLGSKNSSLKVFLVAVPNQVIQEYQIIAKKAGLDLYSLEAEVFGITRALVKDNKKTICLTDIGVQSSTINIVDKGFIKRSYSFNFDSNQLTRSVSSVLGLRYDQAEEIKNKEGINSSRSDIVTTLRSLVEPLLMEIKTISAEFFQQEQCKELFEQELCVFFFEHDEKLLLLYFYILVQGLELILFVFLYLALENSWV